MSDTEVYQFKSQSVVANMNLHKTEPEIYSIQSKDSQLVLKLVVSEDQKQSIFTESFIIRYYDADRMNIALSSLDSYLGLTNVPGISETNLIPTRYGYLQLTREDRFKLHIVFQRLKDQPLGNEGIWEGNLNSSVSSQILNMNGNECCIKESANDLLRILWETFKVDIFNDHSGIDLETHVIDLSSPTTIVTQQEPSEASNPTLVPDLSESLAVVQSRGVKRFSQDTDENRSNHVKSLREITDLSNNLQFINNSLTVDHYPEYTGEELNERRADVGSGKKDYVMDQESETIKARIRRYPRRTELHSKNLPKYWCCECKRAFKRGHNLKVHSRVHTGFTPYQCPFSGCGKWFMWPSSIDVHIKTHRRNKHLLPGSETLSVKEIIKTMATVKQIDPYWVGVETDPTPSEADNGSRDNSSDPKVEKLEDCQMCEDNVGESLNLDHYKTTFYANEEGDNISNPCQEKSIYQTFNMSHADENEIGATNNLTVNNENECLIERRERGSFEEEINIPCVGDTMKDRTEEVEFCDSAATPEIIQRMNVSSKEIETLMDSSVIDHEAVDMDYREHASDAYHAMLDGEYEWDHSEFLIS